MQNVVKINSEIKVNKKKSADTPMNEHYENAMNCLLDLIYFFFFFHEVYMPLSISD